MARTCPTTRSSRATNRDAQPDLFRPGPAHGRVRPRAADLHADRRDPRPGQAGVHLGRGQELLRARRFRPARHRRGGLRRGPAGRAAARRLHHHPAGDEELPADRRPLGRAQDQGDHPRHPAREHARRRTRSSSSTSTRSSSARTPTASPPRRRSTSTSRSRSSRSPKPPTSPRCRRRRACCTRCARRPAPSRGGTTCSTRWRSTATSPRDEAETAKAEDLADRAERRHPLRPQPDAAARLLHRRDPPPALREASATRNCSPAA